MAAVSQEAAFYIRSLHPDPPLPLPLLILLLRSWICRCCRGDTLEVLCFDVQRREAGGSASASERESLSGVLQVNAKLNHSAFFLFFFRPLHKSARLRRRLISKVITLFRYRHIFKAFLLRTDPRLIGVRQLPPGSFIPTVSSVRRRGCICAAAVRAADRAMALGGLPGSNADL